MESARAMEADADENPEQRGELLLEAAELWRQAGEHDRAVEVLGRVIAMGGEEGGHARVALAEALFDVDQVEDGRAQLDALRREEPSSAAPYHSAAELLEERGEQHDALTWFDLAVARLSEQELAERDHGSLSYANQVLVGRRRVRQALGLPPDELDDSLSGPGPRRHAADNVVDLARARSQRARRPENRG